VIDGFNNGQSQLGHVRRRFQNFSIVLENKAKKLYPQIEQSSENVENNSRQPAICLNFHIIGALFPQLTFERVQKVPAIFCTKIFGTFFEIKAKNIKKPV